MSESKSSARAKRGTTDSDDVKAAMRERFPDGMEFPPPVRERFPFAYAIIEGPPGQWSAVCLEGVTAREVQRLEPNGDAEPMFRATQRLVRAIEMRTIGKRWRKP
jgi:hypothetical protein